MSSVVDVKIMRLQDNLMVIRKVAGWTVAELGELIGVTKQTISNLENKKTSMTKTQYIAIRAVLDAEMEASPENVALPQLISILIDSEEISEEDSDKVGMAVSYVTGAKATGKSDASIAAGLTTLLTTLALTMPICTPVVGAVAASVSKSEWLKEAIAVISKKRK